MTEHHIEVARTARYFQRGALSSQTGEVWMVCHGYGHLAQYFIKQFEGVAEDARVIVAPEGLSRFYWQGFDGRIGASWMTKEDRLHEIADYISFFDSLYQRLRSEAKTDFKLVVLGFSQGAATAARWAAKGCAEVDRLILWAGLLPPDLTKTELQRLKPIELEIVYGTNDEYGDQKKVDEHIKQLQEQEFSLRTIPFDGGHEIQPNVLKELTK